MAGLGAAGGAIWFKTRGTPTSLDAPDQTYLIALLLRVHAEQGEQLSPSVREIMSSKAYREIRIDKRPNPVKGGTDVTFTFER